MDTASKLQDPRATARWHNIWLGTALFFLVSTVTFSGLFGWAFTQWKAEESCHEYSASLVYLPLGNYTLSDTTFLHRDGELHYRKGAAYDKSSCEGKLVQQLISTGNVLDPPEGNGRRLFDADGFTVDANGVNRNGAVVKMSVSWNGCTCVEGSASLNGRQLLLNKKTVCTTPERSALSGAGMGLRCKRPSSGHNSDYESLITCTAGLTENRVGQAIDYKSTQVWQQMSSNSKYWYCDPPPPHPISTREAVNTHHDGLQRRPPSSHHRARGRAQLPPLPRRLLRVPHDLSGDGGRKSFGRKPSAAHGGDRHADNLGNMHTARARSPLQRPRPRSALCVAFACRVPLSAFLMQSFTINKWSDRPTAGLNMCR